MFQYIKLSIFVVGKLYSGGNRKNQLALVGWLFPTCCCNLASLLKIKCWFIWFRCSKLLEFDEATWVPNDIYESIVTTSINVIWCENFDRFLNYWELSISPISPPRVCSMCRAGRPPILYCNQIAKTGNAAWSFQLLYMKCWIYTKGQQQYHRCK